MPPGLAGPILPRGSTYYSFVPRSPGHSKTTITSSDGVRKTVLYFDRPPRDNCPPRSNDRFYASQRPQGGSRSRARPIVVETYADPPVDYADPVYYVDPPVDYDRSSRRKSFSTGKPSRSKPRQPPVDACDWSPPPVDARGRSSSRHGDPDPSRRGSFTTYHTYVDPGSPEPVSRGRKSRRPSASGDSDYHAHVPSRAPSQAGSPELAGSSRGHESRRQSFSTPSGYYSYVSPPQSASHDTARGRQTRQADPPRTATSPEPVAKPLRGQKESVSTNPVWTLSRPPPPAPDPPTSDGSPWKIY
jgi:hypothetical protein